MGSDRIKLQTDLREGFRKVINQHSAENVSNIPDHVIADHLVRCFNILNDSVRRRDEFFNVHLYPGHSYADSQPAESDNAETLAQNTTCATQHLNVA